jgi:hypothetical protein
MDLLSPAVNGNSRSVEVALYTFSIGMRLQNLGFTGTVFGCTQNVAAGASR